MKICRAKSLFLGHRASFRAYTVHAGVGAGRRNLKINEAQKSADSDDSIEAMFLLMVANFEQ